ncbi:hypothetical protein VKT23_017006 [Stygiomarasmius scandens]|uniref:Uncharacterized protein n=1 Tax=Marasmiellus scandens TaxID=2682957 RepID=A0ABR1ITI2_9AGAR
MSGTAADTSASAQKKRKGRHNTPPPAPGPSRTRGRPRKKAKTSEQPAESSKTLSKAWYRLKNEDIPEKSQGTKLAFFLHLHLIWQLLKQDDIPKAPTEGQIQEFEARFSTEADVFTLLSNPPPIETALKDTVLFRPSVRSNQALRDTPGGTPVQAVPLCVTRYCSQRPPLQRHYL